MVGWTKLCFNFYSCWFSLLLEHMTLMLYAHFLAMIFCIATLLYGTHLCYKIMQITFCLLFLEGLLWLLKDRLIFWKEKTCLLQVIFTYIYQGFPYWKGWEGFLPTSQKFVDPPPTPGKIPPSTVLTKSQFPHPH